MGLQSAMTTALTGLQAAETTIDVVGNNVANSSTVGFKESSAVFATQFLQTQSIGSAPSDTSGGTNPRQTGLGVTVASITPDFTQGTIEVSSNALDVAIQGEGFLIVQGSGQTLYTRNGELQTNANNEIVTVTGNRVLGYGVDDQFNIVETQDLVPLTIPLGEETVAQATENVYMTGTLSPTAEVGDEPEIILSEVLGDGSIEYPDDTDFDLNDFTIVNAPNTNGSSAADAGTVGALAAGDYEYKLTWYTVSDGELLESPASAAISYTNVAGEDIDLSDLPTDAGDSSWTGRLVYRSIDGGDFELVDDLDLLTETWTDDGSALPGDSVVAAAGAVVGDALDDGALDQGNYTYYITFYNEGSGVESRPTSAIGALSVSEVNGRILIEDIPQPVSGEYDAVRIYRNLGDGSSEFYLVDTISDGQTSYVDSVTNAEIEAGGTELDLMGPKASSATALVDVVVRDGDEYTSPFEEGVLSFTGTKGGLQLETKELTITATTTVQDLIDFMDEAMGVDSDVTGQPDDEAFDVTPGGRITDGQIQLTSNMGIENALGVSLTAFRLTPTGSTSTESVSIAFTETQEANGEGSTTNFAVYDSLGIAVNVRITTVLESKDGDNTVYRWYATSQDNEPSSGVDTALGNGTITFDSNGNVISGETAQVAVLRSDTASASPLEFTVDFSQLTGLAVQDSSGNDTSSTMSMSIQDGFPPGTLTSFNVTESGLILGVFSNGTSRPLGQIIMARFANSAGLEQAGNNMYAESVNSGEPIEGIPGEGGLGALTAGAVELSNSDIGQNLIELILASTQYRGGARVITAAQEMLDELMALRR